eukprot:5614319-Pyramimonas_sp.AAC.1
MQARLSPMLNSRRPWNRTSRLARTRPISITRPSFSWIAVSYFQPPRTTRRHRAGSTSASGSAGMPTTEAGRSISSSCRQGRRRP